MEGVTDIMFRQVIAHAGRPDLFFTEFTNVSSYASEKGRANALERLEIAPTDSPIIAQIWGKNPEHFSETCQALASLGFSGVDLNFGCPDRHVNKAGGGAAMIKTPDLAVECFRNAQNSTHLPVSIKTRLGWSDPDEYKTWLPVLLNEHPTALTVHLHAQKLYQKYPEIDGFMIGRGVFENPYCFIDHTPTSEELMELLKLHLDLYEKQSLKYYISYESLKHFFKIYVNNFPGAKDLRTKLMETHSVSEAKEILSLA